MVSISNEDIVFILRKAESMRLVEVAALTEPINGFGEYIIGGVLGIRDSIGGFQLECLRVEERDRVIPQVNDCE
jgi:hypothetical protein